MEEVNGRTRADDLTAVLRPKSPFIRFSFHAPIAAIYQTILMKEFIADEEYAALAANDYVRSKLWPTDPMKIKPCILKDGKAVFLEPDDKIERTELAESLRKDLDQYCIRFFEYRRHVLETALSSGQVNPSSRKLARLMIKFNGYAIDQVKSEGARVSLPPLS